MKSIRVLDCTLRDGGYYTDWDFSQDTVERYVDGISRLPVDIIEIGYCNHPCGGYYGRFYFLTAPDLKSIRARLRPDQRLAVMLNVKDTDSERVSSLLDGLNGVVDIVRLAVPPSQLGEALDLADAINALGFEVGFNLMYLSSYVDDTSLLSPLTGRDKVLGSLALVDSYGSCLPEQVSRAVKAVSVLLPGLPLGFHGHDNMGLAFANTLAAIDAGAVIVDSTLTGMGRGAGNTRTELFLVHQASREKAPLNYEALSGIVGEFERLRQRYQWGTSLPYMISGAAGLPQRDVMDWLSKNRYSTLSILRALQRESSGSMDTTSYPLLSAEDIGQPDCRDALLIGGGSSIAAHGSALARLAQRDRMVVIHANVSNLSDINLFGPGQLVCLAGQAVMRLPSTDHFNQVKAFVVPSAPRFEGAVPGDTELPILEVNPFSGPDRPGLIGPISDIGPLSLALGCALAIGARRVWLAGFDGYAEATIAQQGLASEIQSMLNQFIAAYPDIEMRSLTQSLYNIKVQSVYSKLAT